MVWLRSRRETGDDARFLSIQGFEVPHSSLHYCMRVLPCRVFRAEDEILYSPFLGFIAYTMGFVGEGNTLCDTADDTCRKLVSYIEHRVRGGLPPYHGELHVECWREHGKLFAECDFEGDFERHEGKGEMVWGSPTDFHVFAQLLEGTVNQVGWREEGSSSWFVWKEPGFSSLD